MKNKLIVGNFKMNLTFDEVIKYIEAFKNFDKEKMIVCPTSIYAKYFIDNGFNVGIQDIYCYNTGAYTGEVSAYQAKSIGIHYAIIGHSERRKYFSETNELINQKVKSALDNNLKVIFCIGETASELELGHKEEVLKNQISIGLEGIKDFSNIVIAYEPVWAIGTNVIPTNEQIKEVISFIKQFIKEKYHQEANILYGGSVNSDNIGVLCEVNNVDGFLIGGSSIKSEEFIGVINQIR